MSVYSDALDDLVASIDAAGIDVNGEPLTVTRDPVEIMSGSYGVLVSIERIDWPLLDGEGVPTVQARLVATAADSAMSDLLEIVDAIADLLGITGAVAATWTPPGADPLPCFLLSTI